MNRILIFMILYSSQFSSGCLAQLRHEIDSLRRELDKSEAHIMGPGRAADPLGDSVRAELLFKLSWDYITINHDSSAYYAQQCADFSSQTGFKKGIGKAYNIMAVLNKEEGNYQLALNYLQKSLAIFKEIGYRTGIARYYYVFGNIYSAQGNYSEAVKNHLKALKIYEELGDKQNLGDSYNTIGAIYALSGNNQEAEKNYLISLGLKEGTGDSNGISAVVDNLGLVYLAQGRYDEAKAAYIRAIKINEQTGNKSYLSSSLMNLGEMNALTGNYQEALIGYQMALKLRDKWDKGSIADIYNHLARLYEMQGDLTEALKYGNKGLLTGLESGKKDIIKESYKILAGIHARLQNYKSAYDYEVLYTRMSDTIENKEYKKKLAILQMQFEFDKKEALAKADQEKKNAMALREMQKQRMVRNGFVGGFSIVLFFGIVVVLQRNRIRKGKRLSDKLLLNVLPSEVAEELKRKGSAEARQFDDVSVMFTDFKDFTEISKKLSPAELLEEINTCFKAFDNIIDKYSIEKIKTIGDSYMAAGGIPVPNKSHAADLVQAALEIQKFMEEHYQQRTKEGREAFELRIGIHTGPVVAGIVGNKKFAYDIWGDTVNVASRMESSGEAGKVNISGSTCELVKDQFHCTHRGKVEAKKMGMIDMYFVTDREPEAI